MIIKIISNELYKNFDKDKWEMQTICQITSIIHLFQSNDY